jgi:ATP-dependent exoDNAse (exonuclease V) alpha subunit
LVNQDNWRQYPKEVRPLEFDYSYGITTWKGQGSEWDKVVVFADKLSCNREVYQRYLYTSVTRSKHKLIVGI